MVTANLVAIEAELVAVGDPGPSTLVTGALLRRTAAALGSAVALVDHDPALEGVIDGSVESMAQRVEDLLVGVRLMLGVLRSSDFGHT